jgi:hypothetical protein
MKNLTGQKLKVFNALNKNIGEWVSGQYFSRTLFLSQYHARIFELQDLGYDIVGSDFKDTHGFKSYRLVPEEPTQSTLL